MEIRYDLTKEDVEDVEFSTRFICDRISERPGFINPKEGKFEMPFGRPFARRDMFWINCKLNYGFETIDLGGFSVEPDRVVPEKFYLARCYCSVDKGYEALKEKAHNWFKTTPEYQNQIAWNKKLIELAEKDLKDGFTEARKVE